MNSRTIHRCVYYLAIIVLVSPSGVVLAQAQQHKNRIVGGKDVATRHSYSYLATLWSNKRGHRCAGVLISPGVVLSAGHCNHDDVEFAIFMRHDLHNAKEEDFEQRIAISSVLVHPNYEHPKFDVALFFLNETTTTTTMIEPIEINTNTNIPSLDGEELITMGWGLRFTNSTNPITTTSTTTTTTSSTTNTTDTSNVLQRASLYYLSMDACHEQAETHERFASSLITDDMLCAKSPNASTCLGDSGGPLVSTTTKNNNNNVLVGIVSWGVAGCMDDHFPSIFSRVSASADFIMKQTCLYDAEKAPVYMNCVGYKPYLTLEIQFDLFPDEVGWTLAKKTSSTGSLEIVQESFVGGFSSRLASSRIVQHIPLSQSSSSSSLLLGKYDDTEYYTFSFIDEDRLCCKYGQGGFKLWFGNVGNTLFGSSDSSFVVRFILRTNDDDDSTVSALLALDNNDDNDNDNNNDNNNNHSPTITPPLVVVGPPPPDTMRLVLRLDGAAHEFGWTLDVLDDMGRARKRLVLVSIGTYSNFDKQVISVHLNHEEKYKLTLVDSGDNGLCCRFGNGLYQVWIGGDSTPSLIAWGGDFGAVETVFFQLDEKNKTTLLVEQQHPTMSPTITSPTTIIPPSTTRSTTSGSIDTTSTTITSLLPLLLWLVSNTLILLF